MLTHDAQLMKNETSELQKKYNSKGITSQDRIYIDRKGITAFHFI